MTKSYVCAYFLSMIGMVDRASMADMLFVRLAECRTINLAVDYDRRLGIPQTPF